MKDEKRPSLGETSQEDYRKRVEPYMRERFGRLEKMHKDGSLFIKGQCPFMWIFKIPDPTCGTPYESIFEEEIIVYGGLEHAIRIGIEDRKIIAELIFELGGPGIDLLYGGNQEYHANVERLKATGQNILQGLVQELNKKGIDIEMGKVTYVRQNHEG